ncbi:molybdenum cofactor biosynthesis protein [Candidatus Bathyarchaeota archaeon]|nr:MAG: molybdenum cofactor biosynthesis protein [Candidatus Bathyarchaeota archaeon]
MSETAMKHKAEAPKSLKFAVITCSSSRYESFSKTGRIDDPSGDLITRAVEEAGHRVTLRRLVPDDRAVIQRVIMKALRSKRVDAIITCGGTGISPKDVTIEAVRPLLEKELDGFGELFRSLSYEEIGSAAMMTRAIAGVSGGKAVFCIPGSPQGISIALKRLILPEVGHVIKHARE